MNGFMQKIVGLCLLGLLLPENELRRYADLGAGLCLTLCMLRALQALLRGFL